MIRAIDGKSVHRICSGQVVLSLGVAVKELVENSLDAGATHVDVKLKSHGSALVQVSDNGTGILEEDFEGLTLKHHTSKIRDFDDLPGVQTFGFRGEALSSLCALSELSLHTRHASSPVGTRLHFDAAGRIARRETAPRGQPGTTVSVANLFSPLPVRRRELERNAKRELSRALHILTAYCLIHPAVRFSVSHDARSGSLLSTDGRGKEVRDCIASVFGPRAVQQLRAIETPTSLPDEALEEFRVKRLAADQRVTGWISSPVHGQGRSSADRQFLFINQRPCEVARITRLVNDVYRELNRHQYPFLLLEIAMSRDDVDVNVTPDKRSLFFDNEPHLLALVKTAVSAALRTAAPAVGAVVRTERSREDGLLSLLKRRLAENRAEGTKQRRLDFLSVRRNGGGADERCLSTNSNDGLSTDASTSPASAERRPNVEEEMTADVCQQTTEEEESSTPQQGRPDVEEEVTADVEEVTMDVCQRTTEEEESSTSQQGRQDVEEEERTSLEEEASIDVCQERVEEEEEFSTTTLPSSPLQRQDVEDEETSLDVVGERMEEECEGVADGGRSLDTPAVDHLLGAMQEEEEEEETEVAFSLQQLRQRLASRLSSPQESGSRCFLAKIEPGDNCRAEEELQRHLSKRDFLEMSVIGQFNLGFIIARLRDDLFIVDQHATDEKFNFERLEREHVMEPQLLIRPQTMELSAAQELTLLEHQDVFHKNGFRFRVDDGAAAGRKVALTSTPMSGQWEFGVADVEEMIFVLDETRTSRCRPSKVRRMLASRACRSSIMIGTALNAAEMRRLLGHMADMDVPWSCPHGRPTIRHLGNLPLLRMAAG